MSDLERLQAIKTNLLTAIQAATENPRPDYTVDGETYNWSSYLKSLQDQLKLVDEQLAAYSDDLQFEIEVLGH